VGENPPLFIFSQRKNQFQGIRQLYNIHTMKIYILRTSALWGRGLILALLSVSLVALFTQYAYAQVRFAKTYGGTDSDEYNRVRRTSDGGYIVTGRTSSFGAGWGDIFLIKTDAYGNLQWAKTYGGASWEYASSAQQTSDGGYIVAGYTNSFGAGNSDFFLIKTDASGNIIWVKTYGGINDDNASSVQQTSDGGYIVAGYTNSFGAGANDFFLIKTDANGNVQWAKTYGGTSGEWANSAQRTSDGGYIVVGLTWSFGASGGDIFLVKTDANGNVQWAKTYGGAGWDQPYSVQQTSDGGYILTGETTSFGAGDRDFFLIKTDANGNVQWAKIYGGTNWDQAFSVQQTSDGGYMVAGSTWSFGAGMSDFLLIKTDANGNVIWAKTYGTVNNDIAWSVQQTSDGGYIVAGDSPLGMGLWDIFLIKTDANGNIGSCAVVQVQDITPTVTTPSLTLNIVSPSFNNVSPTIFSVSPTVTSPTFTVSEPCFSNISEFCQPVSDLITLYKGGIKVSRSGEFEVKVYNISGVMVKSVKGKDEVKLELSRGVYFVEVISGGKVLREKVLIR
jgi:hypothetical protein